MKKHRTSAGRLSRPAFFCELEEIATRVADLWARHLEFIQAQPVPGWQRQADSLLSELNRRIEWTLHQLVGPQIGREHDLDERSVELLSQILAHFAHIQETRGDSDTLVDSQLDFLMIS